MSIKVKQIDMGQISGALLAAGFVSGEVIRPSQTGGFVTSANFDTFEATVQGQVLNVSGLVESSGRWLYTGKIETSGQYLLGLLASTGLTLYNSTTGFDSGLFLTGLGLYNSIQNLSGSLNATGALISSQITNLSGSFNTSGQNLQIQINNLTGSLLATGRGLELNLLNLSGSLNLTGAALHNDLNTYLAGATTLNGLSGAAIVTGSGIVTTSRVGQTIYVSGSDLAASIGRIISINGLTGVPFITGTGSITVHTIGSGIYISGDFITAAQTGAFAASGNLTDTGQFLLSRDNAISGYLLGQIIASNAGVSSINNLSGIVNLAVTGGLVLTTGAGQITISGSSITGMPNWLTNSPDTFTAAAIDDDFDGAVLAAKWTGVNVNVDSSGIGNSHFWANGRAAASSVNRSSFVQGITTGVDWEIRMKCNFLPRFINNQGIGLVMGNATSAKNTVLGYEYSASASQFAVRHYNAYDSTAAIAIEGAVSGFPNDFKNAYFRLQSRSNAMTFDYSNDAIIWRTVRNFTYTGNAASINQVGFFVNPNASQISLAVDYFKATGLT